VPEVSDKYKEIVDLLKPESRLNRKQQLLEIPHDISALKRDLWLKDQEIQLLNGKVALLESQKQETDKRLELAERMMLRVMNSSERSAWFAEKLNIQGITESEQLSVQVSELVLEERSDFIRTAFGIHTTIEGLVSQLMSNRRVAVSHFLNRNNQEYDACIRTINLNETELTEICKNIGNTFQNASNALARRKTKLGQLKSLWLTVPGVDPSLLSTLPTTPFDLNTMQLQFNDWIESFKKAVDQGTLDSISQLQKGKKLIQELLEMVALLIRKKETEFQRVETRIANALQGYQKAVGELQYTTEQRSLCRNYVEHLPAMNDEELECERRCRRIRHQIEDAEFEGQSNVTELRNQLSDAINIRAECRRRVYECKDWIRRMALSTLPELLTLDDNLTLQILNIGRDEEDMELRESLDEYQEIQRLTPMVTRRRRNGTSETFIFKQLAITATSANRINNEIRLLKKLKHENIGELSNVIRCNSDIYLKMPDYSEGSLETWLRQSPPPSEDQKRAVFHRILKGLAYIHLQNVVHLDIKPANVVLQRYGSQLNPRIIDFGISKDLSVTRSSITTTLGGTAGYEAPEVIERRQRNPNNNNTPMRRIGVEADLWSFGVMLWEAFLSAPLILGPSGNVVIPPECPLNLQPLLRKLLQRIPRDRGSAQYCLINFDFWNNSISQSGALSFQTSIQETRDAIQSRISYLDIFDIHLSRDNVLDATLALFTVDCNDQSVWNPSQVNFDGEGAIDAGGPKREFYNLFFSKIVDRFFVGDEGSFLPLTNDKATTEIDNYRSIGKVMAKAIVDEAVAGVNFAKPLFKFLLTPPNGTVDWTIDDLNDYSPEAARNLLWIEHATEEELELYGLDVTPSNRNQYIINQCLELIDSRRLALMALKEGFDILLQPLIQCLSAQNKLHILTSEVLHALLVGNIQMDAETVIPCLQFDYSWSAGSPTPDLLRDWIRTLDSNQLKLFWCFCTGSTALVAGGRSRVVVSRMHIDNLPESHTCSFNLVIPEYNDATTLANKMQIALNNAVGFGFA